MSRSDMLPFWTDAYLADTMHLNNEQHGCYLKLLIFAWRQSDCRIKNDDTILKNVLGVTPRKLSSLKPVLLQFWEIKDGYLTQKRLSVEAEKRRLWAAEKRGGSKKSLHVDALDVQKSQEMYSKNPNENNECSSIAVAVADIEKNKENNSLSLPVQEREASLELFWNLYPATEGQSKDLSRGVWRALSELDRQACLDFLKGTKAQIKTYPFNFLKNRSWESVAPITIAVDAPAEGTSERVLFDILTEKHSAQLWKNLFEGSDFSDGAVHFDKEHRFESAKKYQTEIQAAGLELRRVA